MNFMTKYYRSPEHVCYALRQFVFTMCFFAGLWLLSSCEKPPTVIGGDILPHSDYISITSTDTFKITSYTDYVSEIRTDALRTPYIGVYSDPYFGTTTSGFVTQLRLEREWEEAVWTIDSVRLVLRVKSNYRQNDDFKYLRISEISNRLDDEAAYYSNTHVDTTGYGVSPLIPQLSDTINTVRIDLPPSFGEYLIRKQNMLFYTTKADEEDFRDYFKGIYLTIPSATAADPFLLEFDFTYFGDLYNYGEEVYDYQNYIVLYLKDSTGWCDEFRFLLDSRRDNIRFTKIEHDFSVNVKNTIDYQLVDSLSYVQGLYGAYTTISIPGLEAIKNDPDRARSAVNKAKLIVPVHLITSADTVAPLLYMRYVKANGDREIVPDFYIGSNVDNYDYDYYSGDYVVSSTSYRSYFDGTLDTEKYVYNFNLSNFVQNYLNDTQDKLKPELEIFLPASNISNVVLKANDSKNPLKFELTLTDY